jgi:cytidine deaminase
MVTTIYCLTFQNTSRAFYEINKFSIHAEKCSIMSVRNKQLLKKSKILVVKLIDHKPVVWTCCSMCTNLLKKYNLKTIEK